MIAIVLALPARPQHAERGPLAEVPAIAQDAACDALIDRGEARLLATGEDQVVDPIPCEKTAESVGFLLAGDLEPGDRIGHRTSEDERELCIKEVRSFEEERALLREEEGETRVDVELGGVGLDLREVRIDRKVQRHVRRHSPARGDPGLDLLVGGSELAVQKLPLLGAMTGESGRDLEIAARLQALEPGEILELADGAITVLIRDDGAHAVEQRPGPVAQGHEAPGLHAAHGREPELPERERHLDHIALLGDAPRGLPDGIPGKVLAPLDVGVDRIHLDAQRIDPELESPAAVLERIDHESDRVVVGRSVTLGKAGADLPRLRIGGPEGDIQALVVIGDQGHRLHRCRTVTREPFMVHRNGSGLLPRRLVQHTVDADRRGGAGDLEALLRNRVGARRGQGESEKSRKGQPGRILRHRVNSIHHEAQNQDEGPSPEFHAHLLYTSPLSVP